MDVQQSMKNLIGVGALLIAVSISGPSSTLATPVANDAARAPLMTVVIKPGKVDEAAARGDVDVTMTIPDVTAAAGEPFLSMGMFTPGLARPQVLKSLSVKDSSGTVPLTERKGERGPQSWAPARAISGATTIEYRLLAENIPALSGGPPTALRVDGAAISAVGGSLLISPALKGDYRIALKWDTSAMSAGAQGVSSWGDGDVDLPAGPIARLERAVYMAGPLERETRGAFSAVWVAGQPPFDPRPPMQWTAMLHLAMSAFFKDATQPPYRVFMRFNPMNAGGGAALTHSFIVTYGKNITGESIKSILGHEMTHTWTANGIGAWYNEGIAVYYQALIPWRAGLIDADQYLQDLNETAYRYFTNALRYTPEAEVGPRFWEDTRIRVLPYDRGAMYFAVLDGKLRRVSGGKRSVDDLIQTMMLRVRDGQPVSESVWVELLRKEIGDDGPATHGSMMAGRLMLPESDDFGPCFRRIVKKMRQFDLGFDNASIVSNPKIIRGLKADSAAAKAGLRDGDQVTYAVALDAVQGDLDRTLTLQVTRGNETFPITYRPRGAVVDAYQWERIPDVADAACSSAAAQTPAEPPQPPRPSNDPREFLKGPPKPARVKGRFSVVALGDLLYSRPMANRPDPELQQVIALIKSGDVTIANREGPILDSRIFKGTGYGNGLLWGEPTLAQDQKAMGIDMVSVANNHSTDWGAEGLLETMQLHDAAGIVHSGGGRNLQEARRAGIFTTPKGRVALVSTASSFKANAGANDAFGEVGPRTGISILRTRAIRMVTPDQMAMVRSLAAQFASPLRPAPAADAPEITLGEQIYRLGDKPGLKYEMDLYDHAGLLQAVREAKDDADLVVFTIHAHESPTGFDDDTPAPPDFLIKLFHDCVDAGADVILGGGPHSLRGVEIYKGKVVLYGMGVFFINGEIKALQETALRVFPDATGRAPPPKPAERSVRPGGNPASWYDSVVAIAEFDGPKAKLVKFYPLDVGNTYDRARRGIPHFADPQNAQRILTTLQRDSAQFGTRIEIDGSVGVIRIP